MPIGNNIFNIKNFQSKWHIPEKEDSHITKKVENLDNGDKPMEENQSINTEEEIKNEITLDCQEEFSEKCSISKSDLERKLTQESVLKDSRRFNIDLVPKVIFILFVL